MENRKFFKKYEALIDNLENSEIVFKQKYRLLYLQIAKAFGHVDLKTKDVYIDPKDFDIAILLANQAIFQTKLAVQDLIKLKEDCARPENAVIVTEDQESIVIITG